jgi:NAD-dependent deacetylase
VDVEAFVTAAAIARDPDGCFRMHRSFATLAARAEPNAAHRAIAELAGTRPPGHVTVITQNVDGLHQKAGSPRVIELHGSLSRLRCPDAACGARAPAPDPQGDADAPPPCPRCGASMRYDIVLFDEYLDPADERAAKEALRECDVFLAVGTSGVVFPAASYVREADYAGARTVFVNVEPPSPPNPYFDDVVLGRAEEILPVLLGGA